ncbi:hypothetical protein IAU59_006413 [Kwoniella sp. CBS 9459]
MSDPRFARLKTDPRFRRPKQKDLKVEIDDRFRDVLESEEFGGKGKGKGKASARVDARGRPLTSSHHADQLKRFYRLRSPEKGTDGAEEGEGEGFVDYARGEGALYSSGSEDGSDAESEVEEEELELGGKRKSRLPGQVSDSESDSEDDDDESHLKIDLSENEAESAFPPEADDISSDEDQAEEESVPPTKRIAAVNLDWDNLRAADLYAVFNSFLSLASTKALAEGSKSASGASALGKLLNVKIYPSEFGKERMAKEEQEGPGGGIFVSKHGDKKSKSKNKGPKEAIVLQKHQQQDEDEEESDDEEDEELDDEEEVESAGSDEDLLDEAGSDDLDDEDDEEDDDEEDYISGEDDDDVPPPRSNDRRDKEIDGLEIISDVESEAGSEDIDMDQLRQYQLERLRYFYAIATFSTVAASEYVMNECNGTEFERTANIMDLSYVPEEMEFADDEIRDEATKEPKGYKGNDFVTDALRHSKVKLTWDQDDPNRVKMTRRTLTREEIEEQDFNNLVAGSGSESSDDEEDDNFDEVNGTSSRQEDDGKGKKEKVDKKSKKAAMKERTAKLRELLLAGDDEGGDIWGKAGTAWADELEEIKNPKSKSGNDKNKSDSKNKSAKKDDVEITFKPGLSTNLGAGGAEEENMTSLERYQLRMKEKRARKKEKMELKRAAREGSASGSGSGSDSDGERGIEGGDRKSKSQGKTKKNDDFFGSDSEGEADRDVVSDTGFDEDEDTQYAAKASAPKSNKSKTKPGKSDDKQKSKSRSDDKGKGKGKGKPDGGEDISALVGAADRPDTNFSMKDILKSEKEATKRRKRRRGGKKGANDNDQDGDEKELGPDGWKIDVRDDRFKALHEDAEFAIDPSNPHFTKTKAMQDLLAERTRIRQSKNKNGSRPEAEGLRSATGIKRDPIPGQAGTDGNGRSEDRDKGEKDLSDLVKSVKRKMGEGGGKRKRHRK